jgi:hypothetical protein
LAPPKIFFDGQLRQPQEGNPSFTVRLFEDEIDEHCLWPLRYKLLPPHLTLACTHTEQK